MTGDKNVEDRLIHVGKAYHEKLNKRVTRVGCIVAVGEVTDEKTGRIVDFSGVFQLMEHAINTGDVFIDVFKEENFSFRIHFIRSADHGTQKRQISSGENSIRFAFPQDLDLFSLRIFLVELVVNFECISNTLFGEIVKFIVHVGANHRSVIRDKIGFLIIVHVEVCDIAVSDVDLRIVSH